MIEAFTSPMTSFQFKTTSKLDEDRMMAWLKEESEWTEHTGWIELGNIFA